MDEEKTAYLLDEVLDKVVVGDCLKVMKKYPRNLLTVFLLILHYFILPQENYRGGREYSQRR